MNNTFDKLLSLMKRRSGSPEEDERQKILARIVKSSEYRTLSGTSVMNNLFSESYSFSVLDSLETEELENREALLPIISSFCAQLVQCIYSGNGPELSPDDYPDLTSYKSLSRLVGKIRLAHKVVNYSNIDVSQAMEVFSPKTVRSARECLERLPLGVTTQKTITAEDISMNIGNVMYCVSIEEFNAAHREFLDYRRYGESVLRKERLRNSRHMLLKIAVVMICFGTVFAASQFGMITGAILPKLYGAVLIASVMFLIWG